MADELKYVEYDPEELWKTAMKAYIEAGGDILYPGDEKEMIMRSMLALGVLFLTRVDVGLKMMTLTHATGTFLDIKGDDQHCPRIEAKAAEGAVEIYFDASGISQIIPAGTQMCAADGQRFYETTADIAQTGYEQLITAQIRCVEAGALGNGIPIGTQMQLAKNNPAVHSITVIEATSGGTDRENDDEIYRERIRKSGQMNSTTGPSGSYEARALEVSADIIDAKCLKTSPGCVCTYLILEDGSDEASIFADVLEAQNGKSTRPTTDNVSVAAAEALPYTLNVRYMLDAMATADIAQAVADTVAVYQEWQDGKIGRAFNPENLIAKMYAAGAIRVMIGEGSSFNGGTAEYTEIQQHQRCKGSISIAQVTGA